MKRAKSLIVLLVVLVVLIGGVVAVKLLTREKPTDEPEDTTITVLSFEQTSIKSVTYKDEKYENEIVFNQNIYYYGADEDFPLNQQVAAYMVSNVTELTATGSVDGTGTLDEYGLDNPQKSITVTLNNGGKTTLLIGTYNEYSDVCYGCIEGNKTVYFFPKDVNSFFGLCLDDLIVNETVEEPADGFSKINQLLITNRDGTCENYCYYLGVDEEKDDDGNIVVEGDPARFVEGEAFYAGVIEGDYSEYVQNIYDEITDLSLTDWVDYNLKDADKEKYGLDTPYKEVRFCYTEPVTTAASDSASATTVDVDKTLMLLIGDRLPEIEEDAEGAEDGEESEPSSPQRYVVTGGGKIVYAVNESDLPTLFGIGVEPETEEETESETEAEDEYLI